MKVNCEWNMSVVLKYENIMFDYKVLVVEDDELFVEMVVEFLL